MRETYSYNAGHYINQNGQGTLNWILRCCTKRASTRVDEEAAERTRAYQERIRQKRVVIGKVAGPSSFTGNSASRYVTPTYVERDPRTPNRAETLPRYEATALQENANQENTNQENTNQENTNQENTNQENTNHENTNQESHDRPQ